MPGKKKNGMDDYLSEYKGKDILITGGAGCIGSALARALIKAGVRRVIILDDLSSAVEWNIPYVDEVYFIEGSVADEKMMVRAFSWDIDVVFHLAAHSGNRNSLDKPETNLEVNGMGILKVLDYARVIGVKRFVYSSSGDGVYGQDSKMPFEEHDISISLHTPYQVTKLLGELYTNYFYNLHGFPVVNARLSNVFGPGETPGLYKNVIPNFFWWAMHGEPLPITGEGTETMDWAYVDDIVDGLLAMGVKEEAVGETINLGSGSEHSVIEMAKMVNEITGNKAGVIYTKRRDWDTRRRALSSIDKARKLLEYEPQMEFREGLGRVHGWLVKNKGRIEKSAKF